MTAKKNTAIETVETPANAAVESAGAAPAVDLAAALVEIPAKICVQIGQRKRYFDTREEALAALTEFTAKQNKPKGPSRTFLTPEQKAERAKKRDALIEFATKLGKEGKMAVALANSLEDICTVIPELHGFVVDYNEKTAAPEQVTPDEGIADTSATVDPPALGLAGDATDPLAEFNLGE